MTTTTKIHSVKDTLDDGDANNVADALRLVKLGTMFTPVEEDTGTITASATILLTKRALLIQSARVVTSGTAGSVGSYLVSDSAAVKSTPTGASAQTGVATIATDRRTITFPNTITRAVIQYIPIGVDPAARFERTGVGQ